MQSLPDRLPLVIGVTGHRDLREQDVAGLEAEIAAIIARLRHDYLEDDAETPIIVLSALAEGADRLVARVALGQGARLIAPLPMPREEYARDFEPGLQRGNAAEFDALLAQAIAAPVIPFTHGNSLEAVRSNPKQRAEQYRAVGLFIIQHCNVLIAIWDGDESNRATGGTAEIVGFARQGIPLGISRSARASLDGSEIGPVIHVIAPRRKQGSPAGEVAVERWGRAVVSHYRGGAVERAYERFLRFAGRLFGIERADMRAQLPDPQRRELDAWETFAVLIALTRQFNREAAAMVSAKRGAGRMAQSLQYLFDDPDRQASAPADPQQIALKLAPRWSRLYSISDTLANDCQRQFKQDWRLLFGLTFAAFICFATFSHVGAERDALLLVYSVAYVVIFMIFLRARAGRHQERFLDYRALAEALRVAVYWRLVGIGLRPSDVKADASGEGFNVDANTVGVLADAYPIKQPSELAWVKICLRTLELLDRAEGVADERVLDPACHGIVRRCWVFGQYMFFRRRGFQHNRVAEVLETWAGIFLVMTAFLLVPILLFVASGEAGKGGFDFRTVVLLLSGLLPGSAAALTAYSERLALKAQARQYDRMRILFERAYELLPERIDTATAALVRAVYRELGIEAMRENAEWVAVYRQRPIEPLP
ncbi:MAG TPA: hypothetical protein VGN55_00360 [Xanthobacteraceae bacterium]